MRTVLLDSSGLIALWDESDQWHDAAVDAFQNLVPPVRLISTTFVLMECGNAAARRRYRSEVAVLWRRLRRDGDLLVPSDEQVQEAWEAYWKRSPGAAGIVDLVSFEVMRERGIREAFTNDAHFRAEGFITLINSRGEV